MSPEMELIDEIDYVEMGSMLARKIQQLMTFFGLLIPDMSNEEEQMLDEALIEPMRISASPMITTPSIRTCPPLRPK